MTDLSKSLLDPSARDTPAQRPINVIRCSRTVLVSPSPSPPDSRPLAARCRCPALTGRDGLQSDSTQRTRDVRSYARGAQRKHIILLSQPTATYARARAKHRAAPLAASFVGPCVSSSASYLIDIARPIPSRHAPASPSPISLSLIKRHKARPPLASLLRTRSRPPSHDPPIAILSMMPHATAKPAYPRTASRS